MYNTDALNLEYYFFSRSLKCKLINKIIQNNS